MPTTTAVSASSELPSTRADSSVVARWSSRAPANDFGAILTLAAMVYLVTAGLLIVVGYGISEGVPTGAIDRTDRDIAATMAEGRTPDLDRLSEIFDTLADTIAVVVLVPLTILVTAIRRAWRSLVVMAVAIPLELLTYVSISFAVDRPRPDEAMGMLPVTPSFPSGHAAMAVVLYGSLAFMLSRAVRSRVLAAIAVAGAAAIAAVVAWARVYAALHYNSDVVFGLLLGGVSLATGVVAVRVLDHRRPSP